MAKIKFHFNQYIFKIISDKNFLQKKYTSLGGSLETLIRIQQVQKTQGSNQILNINI